MSSDANHIEKELFSRIAESDESAFRDLYLRYGKILFPFLQNLTKSETATDDLIQETLLRIWLHRDRLSDVEYPRAWIHRIAANLAINWLRKEAVEESTVREFGRRPGQHIDHPESTFAVQAIRTIVQQTLDAMPAQRRRIWLLHREQGMKATEIASELGISNSTVKNTLVTAARFIREQVEKAGYGLPLWFITHYF